MFIGRLMREVEDEEINDKTKMKFCAILEPLVPPHAKLGSEPVQLVLVWRLKALDEKQISLLRVLMAGSSSVVLENNFTSYRSVLLFIRAAQCSVLDDYCNTYSIITF